MFGEFWKAMLAVMEPWHQGKLFIEHALTIDHDALHILAGTTVWLVLIFALRHPLTAWRPWLGLLALDIWNEMVDLSLEQWPDPGWQYGEAAKDLILTMAIPTLLMFAGRLRPDLIGGRRRGR